MPGRLRSMWRGEIKLWKMFWVFGVMVLLLFSFTFISSQGILAALLGKSSRFPFYLDCFLVLIFIVYGIFLLVVVWRSANKYAGPKAWSPLAKVTSVLMILWFWANLGLYVFVKTAIPPAMEAKIDYIPEKLKLPESDIEADTLYLSNLKLKFPFYKEDIRKVWPFSFDQQHQLMGLTTFLEGNKGMISLHEIPDSLPEARVSVPERIFDWLLNKENYGSYFNTMTQVHYSRLRNYSWWHLRNNLRLAFNLILKAISIPTYDDLKVYDVETPHLKGHLRRGQAKNRNVLVEFQCSVGGKTHDMSLFTADETIIRKFMNMLSTIQPLGDDDKGYEEMKIQYENKNKSRYPEKLLLVSLISLKGPTVDTLEELLRLEENYPR